VLLCSACSACSALQRSSVITPHVLKRGRRAGVRGDTRLFIQHTAYAHRTPPGRPNLACVVDASSAVQKEKRSNDLTRQLPDDR
jgi:hypothetical protein